MGRRHHLSTPAGTFSLQGRSQERFLKTDVKEGAMGLGRGALLWLLGVPIPVIILLALFWHH